MRNPAPVLLTLLLAAAILFFVLQNPEPEATATTAAEPEASEAAAQPAATNDAQQPAGPVWPHEESDIAPDPKAVFGRLDNGFRYIILPNNEPPERISLRLHIEAGSLMEDEDQRGIAHFLEHMVFNGSKNFTPDELIPRMQRLGIAFGAHVNAYTSFDETVYMLDLPEVSDSMLELGLTVMRDFGDGALLEPEEIDKERGVILSEKNSRDSVSYRLMQKQFSTLLPDSLVTKRFPIGEEEVIVSAQRERFVDFYERYYAPRRMTFVVVGDVDPAAMTERIEKSFASMTNPESPGADPELGTVTPQTGLEPAVFTDREVAVTELGLLTIADYEPEPDTRERRIERMPLTIAHSVLGLRFDRRAKEEGSPILGGSASRQDLFNHLQLGSIDLRVADERWQDAVPLLEQEFRRALEYGFTAAELAETKANLLNQYQQAAKAEETRRSDQLATMIASSVNDRRVLTTPATNLEIVEAGLAEISPAEVQAAFNDFWEDKGLFLILTTQQEPDGGAEALGALYEASRTEDVEPPEEKDVAEFAYQDFGETGTVASREDVEDLGLVRLELSNGVRVTLKSTDFERNSIRMEARIGNGRLTLPADKPGLAEFATAVVEGGGIGVHSVDELQQIFAGKNVSFGFSVDDDAFLLSGATTPDDLGLQLRAMTAQILEPGYRQEAVTQFRKAVPMLYQQLKHSSAGPMREMRGWLRGDDPRFVFPDEASTLLAYEAEDAKSWLSGHFSNAPIELSLVGDFETEAAIAAILESFGAIAPRGPAEPLPEGARRIDFPAAPATRSFTYESKIPQAQAIAIWETPGPRGNQETFRRLSLLADILGDRLREEIREELGASYSPQAGVNGSEALEDFGFLISLSAGTPEDAPKLLEIMTELADELASEGATDDELDRARRPLLADIDKSLRDNGYWLGAVASGSHEYPEKLELARNRRADVESITLEEINQLATAHLTSARALRVLIAPEPESNRSDPSDPSDPSDTSDPSPATE